MKEQNNAIIGIYKITSPTNKVYIGQATNIERRKQEYELLKVFQQPRIFNSIKKYGWEQHTFKMIEECNIDQLNERERYWQIYYNVLDLKKGLNCRLTNTKDKNGELSQLTKNKISNSRKGMKFTENHKSNISKSKKGSVYSEERNKKISQKLKGIKNNNNKQIMQYDLEGNFIREWRSVSEAKNIINNNKGDGIGACCRKKQKSAYGYIWMFK